MAYANTFSQCEGVAIPNLVVEYVVVIAKYRMECYTDYGKDRVKEDENLRQLDRTQIHVD